jgi:hypothetical protein
MQSMGSKLTAYLGQVRDKPFDWTTNNCSHFAYGWYASLGGQVAHPENLFNSKMAVRLALGDSAAFVTYIDGYLGIPSMPGAYAAVGDIVLVKLPELDIIALGICNGDLTACLSDAGKIVFGDLERVATWKMPNA